MSQEALADEEAREEVVDEVDQYRMPLLDHLRELRTRILRAVVVLFIAGGISLYFAEDIVDFLTLPALEAKANMPPEQAAKIELTILTPFEGIYAYLSAALLGGVTLAIPFLAFEAWGFIAPGLYKTERRIVFPLALSSTVLFLLGAGFAYYAIFPYAFPFFFSVLKDVTVTLAIMGYLSAVVKMMLAFGACFQLPVGAFFLARTGLIDHRDMLSSFRYAMVGIFVVAALITPPDPLTQSLLAAPLILLYGVGIVIAWLFTTKVRDAEGS